MTAPSVREALGQIKTICAGDKIPNWSDDWQTTASRGRILDLCDAALSATPPAPTPSAGRERVAPDELRMLARLAWNNWPDNEKSRSELASFEAKDDISRASWDRVVAAILTATRPAAGLDAPHNSGERLLSSDAAERAAGRPNIALLPDAAAIRAAAFEEAAKIAEGEVYKERYRTWPWWKHDADTIGNRDNESDLVKHCDDIAAAIRSGGVSDV